MSLGVLVAQAVALGRQYHEQLLDQTATVRRETPVLGADGKLTLTPTTAGTAKLTINPATVQDSKLANLSGVELSLPFWIARVALAADVRVNDLLVIGALTYRVKGITANKTVSAIRRAFLVEER